MGEVVLEGFGHPVWDQESDTLELDGQICGIRDLINKASRTKSPTSFVYNDAKEPFEEDGYFDAIMDLSDPYYSLKAWREWSGKKYPPVYRISIRVEAEEVSEAEAEAYFEQRKSEY